MIKHLTLVFIIAIFLFYVPSRIFASDVNILCNSTGCSGLTDKIFDTQNMVPGDSIQKTISIKNEVGESININLLADKDAATDDAFALKASIVLYKDTSLIYSNYFMNFLDESSVSLGTIGNGQTAEYKIEISLAKELGNEIQRKQVIFDMAFAIKNEGTGEVLSSSTSNNSSTSSSSNSSGTSLIGQILGLSDTGGLNDFTFTLFILGVIFILGGLLIILKRRRNINTSL